MKRLLLLVVVLLFPLAAGCSGKNPHYDPDIPHRTSTGFQSNSPHPRPSGLDFWRWFLQRRLAGLPREPTLELAPVPADVDALPANRSESAVTWISWRGDPSGCIGEPSRALRTSHWTSLSSIWPRPGSGTA